jgi:hypothetical protein
MFKTTVLIALAAALALPPAAAFAQQGTSSSYGSVGWGPTIPTQALTPRDREWNHDNQALYQAEAGSEWIRRHATQPGPYPRFP